MKHKINYNVILLLTFLFLTNNEASSQCYWYAEGNQYVNPNDMVTDYWVKVYFHIFRDDNGDNGVPLSRTTDIMNQLSSGFSNHNIHFYNMGYEYIDSTAGLEIGFPYGISGIYSDTDRINIYLYTENETCGGGVTRCGVYTDTSISFGGKVRDTWISSQNFAVHEMGHILGLPHTFGDGATTSAGWEKIIRTGSTANCGTFADNFCDTPATFQGKSYNPCNGNTTFYGVNMEVDTDCDWTNPKTDENGTEYEPDLNNYMEYTRPSCMNHFYNEQVESMRAKLESNSSIIKDAVCSDIKGTISFTGGTLTLSEFNNYVSQRNLTVNINAIRGSSFSWTYHAGSQYTPVSTYNQGQQAIFTVPNNGYVTYKITWNNDCGLGPQYFTFIHTGGYYSLASNLVQDMLEVRAVDDILFDLNTPYYNGVEIIISPDIYTIDIVSKEGLSVQKETFSKGTKNVNINTSKLQSGVYYAIVKSKDRKYSSILNFVKI